MLLAGPMATVSPFDDRPDEWALYNPLVGVTMLELGAKCNARLGRTYKHYFRSLGVKHTSVDWNAEHGALDLDLCLPLKLGTFDMVTNIGTSEHVSDQAAVWRNMLDAMHIGSVLICTTPKPGHWSWHGRWYPTEDFYRDLARLNGLKLERLYEVGEPPRTMIYARLRRLEMRKFSMPPGGMVENSQEA